MEDHRPGSLVDTLRGGGVAVISTDTVYGLVGLAEDASACEKVFRLKGRNMRKKCIVLISSVDDIYDEHSRKAFLAAYHSTDDRPTSIVVPADAMTPSRLKSDDGTIAYRLPRDTVLLELLQQTGPLIAPSANPEGKPPALTIKQAKVYFGDTVDWYEDGGDVSGRTPSRIIHVHDNEVEIIR